MKGHVYTLKWIEGKSFGLIDGNQLASGSFVSANSKCALVRSENSCVRACVFRRDRFLGQRNEKIGFRPAFGETRCVCPPKSPLKSLFIS